MELRCYSYDEGAPPMDSWSLEKQSTAIQVLIKDTIAPLLVCTGCRLWISQCACVSISYLLASAKETMICLRLLTYFFGSHSPGKYYNHSNLNHPKIRIFSSVTVCYNIPETKNNVILCSLMVSGVFVRFVTSPPCEVSIPPTHPPTRHHLA